MITRSLLCLPGVWLLTASPVSASPIFAFGMGREPARTYVELVEFKPESIPAESIAVERARKLAVELPLLQFKQWALGRLTASIPDLDTSHLDDPLLMGGSLFGSPRPGEASGKPTPTARLDAMTEAQVKRFVDLFFSDLFNRAYANPELTFAEVVGRTTDWIVNHHLPTICVRGLGPRRWTDQLHDGRINFDRPT